MPSTKTLLHIHQIILFENSHIAHPKISPGKSKFGTLMKISRHFFVSTRHTNTFYMKNIYKRIIGIKF